MKNAIGRLESIPWIDVEAVSFGVSGEIEELGIARSFAKGEQVSAISTQLSTSNRLLGSLPRSEYERLLSRLEPVHLSKGKIIYEVGDLVRYVYFPSNGLITLLSTTEEGETIEVGMIGSEGTTATPMLTHARRMPYRTVVQIPSEALRCEASIIQDEVKQGGHLNHLLLCYTHSLLTQVAQSAVCNRFHTTEQRFCRWLLCTRDRIGADMIELTHECVSDMLGTPRSVVSVTARALQKAGLITVSRRSITILDGQGLEATACECYAVVKDQVCRCLAA